MLQSSDIVIYAIEPSQKFVEIMRKFSEKFARQSGTYFCVDKGVTSVVIKGLLIIKIHLEHHSVLVGIMMTKLLKKDRDFGTAHVYLKKFTSYVFMIQPPQVVA